MNLGKLKGTFFKKRRKVLLKRRTFYSVMALCGHSLTQAPHSRHASSSITATSSMAIASEGHTSTQAPQATQASGSTFAGTFETSFGEGAMNYFKNFSQIRATSHISLISYIHSFVRVVDVLMGSFRCSWILGVFEGFHTPS